MPAVERVDATVDQARPLVFRGSEHRAPKQFFDGTHRVCPPEETLARIQPFFPGLGITRLADITGLDRIPISTVQAIRPNSRTLANGSGKGFTKIAAMVSAAMETIEHHHAEQDDLGYVSATHDELSSSDSVIAAKDLQVTKHSLFSVDRPERWVAGWDIVSQRERYVPLTCVSMSPTYRDAHRDLMSFQAGSNGLASGNVFLEALTAALFEAIERDATTCWQMAANHGAHPPRVDLESITDPLARDLIERLESANMGIILLDCTVDTALPTYEAYMYDHQRRMGSYKGYGAHLDPAIAMIRAITEAVQARAIYVAGSRDDVFDHARHLMKLAQMSEADVDGLAEAGPARDASSLASEATRSFEGDIAVTIDKLQAAGLHEVVVVDLTRPEFEIPVVKIVVPGLEGYMFNFYTPGWRAGRHIENTRRAAVDREGVSS